MVAEFVLDRIFAVKGEGVFGSLRLLGDGHFRLYTIERNWLNNKPRVSCIPTGLYHLERHSSRRFPDSVALVGGTVSHWPERGKRRSTILLHSGNVSSDLMGCIAPGMVIGTLRGRAAVMQSRAAMDQLREIWDFVGPSNCTLQINDWAGVPVNFERN